MGAIVGASDSVQVKQCKELKKHVATIHCANTFSLLQRKLNNALLYHAYSELLAKEEHEITINQLCNIIGYAGNNHLAIKEALKGLLSTVIEWNVIDTKTEEEDWTASSILASVRIKGSICTYAYSPRMRQLLHAPTIYGKISLIIQAKFRSAYGLALYENCIRYKGLPYTKWFDMTEFRKIMGVSDETYLMFRDFKKRVLDKAIEEVKTHSDLFIELEVRKRGRTVTGLRFKIQAKEKKAWLGRNLKSDGEEGEVTNVPPETDLINKLTRQFGFSRVSSEKLYAKFGEALIIEKIGLIESTYSSKEGKIVNLAALLTCALNEDYQVPKNKSFPMKEKKPTVDLWKEENRKTSELIAQSRRYSNYIHPILNQAMTHLEPANFKSLTEYFLLFLSESNDMDMLIKYKKEGFSNSFVMGRFRLFVDKNFEFISEKYPILIENFLSFEEYCRAVENQT